MDFSHYSDQAMTMAVDLVNTLERVTGEDELSDLEGLVTFLDHLRERVARRRSLPRSHVGSRSRGGSTPPRAATGRLRSAEP